MVPRTNEPPPPLSFPVHSGKHTAAQTHFLKGVWPAISQFCVHFIHAQKVVGVSWVAYGGVRWFFGWFSGDFLEVVLADWCLTRPTRELATENSMINVRWWSCWSGRAVNGLVPRREWQKVASCSLAALLKTQKKKKNRSRKHKIAETTRSVTSANFEKFINLLDSWSHSALCVGNRISSQRFGVGPMTSGLFTLPKY